MAEWCLAHPWMTFFIVLVLVQGPLVTINARRRDED